jgi:hypothetical protein
MIMKTPIWIRMKKKQQVGVQTSKMTMQVMKMMMTLHGKSEDQL